MTDLSALEAKIDDIHENIMRNAPPRMMTTRECAKYLQLSAERLYQLRKIGGGPKFYQPSERTVRYRLEDVDAWVMHQ
jgi:predicted DNA-binding transcriptional regulator AlpA